MKKFSFISNTRFGAGVFLAFCLTCLSTAHADCALTITGSPTNYDTPSPLGYGSNGNIAANSWITNSVDSFVTANGTIWFQ